jgi:hypothetical protein
MKSTIHYLFLLFACALAIFSIKSCSENLHECNLKKGVLVRDVLGGTECVNVR